MKMSRLNWFLPGFGFCFLCVTIPAEASFIQDDYVTGAVSDRLEISESVNFGDQRNEREVADNFTNIQYDPSRHGLKVTWYGGEQSDVIGSPSHDHFRLRVYRGAGGTPGSPLATYSTTDFSTVRVDPLLSDVPEIAFYRYEAYLTGGVDLESEETYWLSIVERDNLVGGPEAEDAWYWMGSANPLLPEDQFRTIADGVPSAWSATPSLSSYGRAFAIDIFPIPEPHVAGMLCLLTGGQYWLRKRRHAGVLSDRS